MLCEWKEDVDDEATTRCPSSTLKMARRFLPSELVLARPLVLSLAAKRFHDSEGGRAWQIIRSQRRARSVKCLLRVFYSRSILCRARRATNSAPTTRTRGATRRTLRATTATRPTPTAATAATRTARTTATPTARTAALTPTA